jgi:16S rRNA G966 N2-methylase RsmD
MGLFRPARVYLIGKLRRTRVWKIAKIAVSRLGGGPHLDRPATSSIEWDRTFGVETAHLVPLSGLSISSGNWLYGTHYEPISVARFQDMLGELKIEHRNFLFIDIGSGKGKAMLLAASYPFKEVIGVEFSPELHRTAEQNVQRYLGAKNCAIRPVCGDAALYEFPPEPAVIYLYNPFEAKILRRVMENLGRSLHATPREIYVLYYSPVERLRDFPEERAVFDNSDYLAPIVQNESYSIYRAVPFQSQ